MSLVPSKYGYVKVNLKPEIEALVRDFAKATGFKESTIRYVAVLLGLNDLVSMFITNNAVLDFDDYSVRRLIEHVGKNIKALTPSGGVDA